MAKTPEKNRIACKKYRDSHPGENKVRCKANYELHREERKASSRAYEASHKEECRLRHKSYWLEHAEEKRAWYRKYVKNHRAMFTARSANRRATEAQRTLSCVDPKEIRSFYLDADWLTKETGIKHSVDHIIPLRGKLVNGLHVPWNLQVITLNDNLKKSNSLKGNECYGIS